jgi:hypothetical protein
MSRRHISIALFGALVVGAATIGLAQPVSAHAGDQTYLYLDVTETTLGGRLEIPSADLATLGLDLDGTDEEILAELAGNEAEIDAYLEEHVVIGDGSTTWPIEFAPGQLFYSDLPEQDGNYVVVDFDVDTGGIEIPRQLAVTLDPFFEIDGRDALLLISNDWAGGVIENSHEVLVAFTSDTRTHTIDLGDTSWFKTFRSSISLGVNHIRTGPDHVLFILVLLLPAVLVFVMGWHPAPSFGASLWRITKIVTMFTVAHTITFTLAGLDMLPLPPPRVVESIIAASIAVAALHNLRPIALNREWMIAFVFGLFHGMGFASLVEDLDVGRGTQLISLLGRNVGIEIAQTAVVLLLFPALFLLRRTVYYRPLFVGASVVLCGLSLGWLIERAFVVDLGMSTFVDPIVEWPRALFFVVALTVLCAGVRTWEDRRGRLLPVFTPAVLAQVASEAASHQVDSGAAEPATAS